MPLPLNPLWGALNCFGVPRGQLCESGCTLLLAPYVEHFYCAQSQVIDDSGKQGALRAVLPVNSFDT